MPSLTIKLLSDYQVSKSETVGYIGNALVSLNLNGKSLSFGRWYFEKDRFASGHVTTHLAFNSLAVSVYGGKISYYANYSVEKNADGSHWYMGHYGAAFKLNTTDLFSQHLRFSYVQISCADINTNNAAPYEQTYESLLAGGHNGRHPYAGGELDKVITARDCSIVTGNTHVVVTNSILAELCNAQHTTRSHSHGRLVA